MGTEPQKRTVKKLVETDINLSGDICADIKMQVQMVI